MRKFILGVWFVLSVYSFIRLFTSSRNYLEYIVCIAFTIWLFKKEAKSA